MPVAVPLIAAVGTIAGSAISANAQNKAQKNAKAQIGQGVDELTGAKNDLLGSDAYARFFNLVNDLSKDPLTYGPGIADQQKAGYADQAWNAYRSALGQSDEQAAQSGQFRGAARANRSNALAQQLGQSIAGNNRNVDLASRQSRVQDMGQLGTLLTGLFNLRSGPSQAIANARLGSASQLASYTSSPLGDLLGGIGAVGTAVGTSPGGVTYNPTTGRYEQQGSLFNQFFSNMFGSSPSQASTPNLSNAWANLYTSGGYSAP